MRLAISNIAWPKESESEIAKQLANLKIDAVEIAPTAVWDDPLTISDDEINRYRQFWAKHGVEIVAFQALLFGHPELTIFDNPDTRRQTAAYLGKIMALGTKLGAQAYVFGSPKNRLVGDRSEAEITAAAQEFFGAVGEAAERLGVTFCIEPNPPEYGADFVTTTATGIDLVKAVDNKGFRLHLDTGGMTLAGDDPAAVIPEALPYLSHFHISEPYLAPVGTTETDHATIAATLRNTGYDGIASIEMKAEDGGHVARVRDAIHLAQKTYGLR